MEEKQIMQMLSSAFKKMSESIVGSDIIILIVAVGTAIVMFFALSFAMAIKKHFFCGSN